jgi:hypothetical protein
MDQSTDQGSPGLAIAIARVNTVQHAGELNPYNIMEAVEIQSRRQIKTLKILINKDNI